MANEFGFEPEAGAAAAVAEPEDDLGFTPLFPSDASLAGVRSGYMSELEDPRVAGQLYGLPHREVGAQGPKAQQAFIETVFNRAAARGATLAQTVADTDYYPAVSLKPAALSQDDITRYRQMTLNAGQGSNIS